MKTILVIAEIFQGRVRQVTWELAAAAREIQTGFSQKQPLPGIQIPPVTIIVPSDNPQPLAKKIAEQTGMDVIGLLIPELKTYTSEMYITCLGQIIRKLSPSHILVAHTSQGRDFAPGLSLALDASSIPSVNGIRFDEKGVTYLRPVFDNTKIMRVRPASDRPLILTLMPGAFKPYTRKNRQPGCVNIQKTSLSPADGGKPCIHHRQILKRPGENQALKAAKIIVAAGRGLGEKENLQLIFTFAKLLSSSAVGASRPLVDMGWIGYEHQVGITGASVAPDVYIACGISGSSQHIAGMKNAKFVISINNNPAAPICRHSDICITEDVLEFIPVFLNRLDTTKPI